MQSAQTLEVCLVGKVSLYPAPFDLGNGHGFRFKHEVAIADFPDLPFCRAKKTNRVPGDLFKGYVISVCQNIDIDVPPEP